MPVDHWLMRARCGLAGKICREFALQPPASGDCKPVRAEIGGVASQQLSKTSTQSACTQFLEELTYVRNHVVGMFPESEMSTA